MHGNCVIAHGAQVSHTGIAQHATVLLENQEEEPNVSFSISLTFSKYS
jgi:hypothetical protein